MLMMRPVAPRDHLPRDSLRHEERAAQVGVQHQVPVLPGDAAAGLRTLQPALLTRTSILSERRGARRQPAADAALVPHVEFERHDRAAPSASISSGTGAARRRCAGDDQIRSGARQRPRECLAEPAARAGHDGNAAGGDRRVT